MSVAVVGSFMGDLVTTVSVLSFAQQCMQQPSMTVM